MRQSAGEPGVPITPATNHLFALGMLRALPSALLIYTINWYHHNYLLTYRMVKGVPWAQLNTCTGQPSSSLPSLPTLFPGLVTTIVNEISLPGFYM